MGSKKPVTGSIRRPLLFPFLGAILVPVTLLCLSVSFGLLNIHKQYQFVQKEIVGTAAVHRLFDGLVDLQKIRGLSRILPWETERSDLTGQRHRLLVQFKSHFNSRQWLALREKLEIDHEMEAIVLEVQRLYEAKNDPVSERDIFDQYTATIAKINNMILTVADRSNLILDPELDTYYLVEVAIKQIPDLCEAIAIIRGLGSGMIAQGGSNKKDSMLFQSKLAVMHEQYRKFIRAKAIIRSTGVTMGTSVADNKNELEQTLSLFLQTCVTLGEEDCQLSAQEFFARGTSVIVVLAESFYEAIEMLEVRLERRLSGYFQLLLLTLLVAIGTIAAICYFAFSFYRRQQESNRELEQLSITDPLTAIPNRRYLDIVFDREMQRARRTGMGMAFGLLDIDFFKRFNDTYGHLEGDLALQQVAMALKNSLQRAGDYFFRFGGEEFCFLFAASSLLEAEEISERIRKSVEELEIEHRENAASPFVTISLGVVYVTRATNEHLDDMIKQADDLLYAAKDRGRNQWVTAALPPEPPAKELPDHDAHGQTG